MKSTFWYIDEIIRLLSKVPSKLRSEEEKRIAKKTLDKIIEYNWKLNKLIEAHKLPEHLNKLHSCHIDAIPDWAERVNIQFKRLNAFMKVLYEDIPKLKLILEKGDKAKDHNSSEWTDKTGDMCMGMLMAGFHHAEQNMEEFRKTEVFERKHLLELIKDLEDVEEILK